MSKEHFIAAHEELVSEYLDKHSDADWSEAYDRTADRAYGRMRGNLADMADALRQRTKDKQGQG